MDSELPIILFLLNFLGKKSYFRPMVLVTGGTGMVGSHLLYFLLKENVQVRAIHRKNSKIHNVKKTFALYTDEVDSLFNKIQWLEADITEIPSLSGAFAGVTQVYHCAAFINFNPAKYPVLKKINVEGTANIVNQCLDNKIEKLCYISSVATFGSKLNGEMITEETPWNPDEKNSVYGITKYGAEMEVWRGTQEGLDAVIVNPGVILGVSPDGDGSGVIVKLASSGIPFYPSGGMGIVDVQDVVEAMVLLMQSGIKNEQFILVGKNISYRELLTKLAPYFGKKPPKKKLPKWTMDLFSSLDWFFGKVFGTKRKLVKATVRSMFKQSYYDASKIKAQVGFNFTSTEKTYERIAKRYKKEDDT